MRNAVYDQLVKNRVYLNPKQPDEREIIQQEVGQFSQMMRKAQGHIGDSPGMFCSAIPDRGADAIDPEQFPGLSLLIISVGGTNTYFRALELQGGEITADEDLIGQEFGEQKVQRRISTPCGDGQSHTLKEMMVKIAEALYPWLLSFTERDHEPHILLNWGFPQKAIELSGEQGITGAIGGPMTKQQSGVKADGERIDSTFRKALQEVCQDLQLQELLQDIRITVQNDTIMAMHRYLTKQKRAPYRQLSLMILGTGMNFTSTHDYAVDSAGRLVLDEEGYALRIDQANEEQRQDLRWLPYWVNYEVGHLQPGVTKTTIDRLLPGEETIFQPSIENFGASGTGFPRILQNLIEDYLPRGQQTWKKLKNLLDCHEKITFDAIFVSQLAGKHEHDDIGFNEMLREFGCSSDEILDLQLIGRVVIHRSALRAAEILSAVSLHTGFGLPEGNHERDALAMEGSVWKIQGYPEKVKKYWARLLDREDLNVDFIVEDDFTAGVLGPAYLVGLWG